MDTRADWTARECEEDWRIHAYRKSELADPAVLFVIPYCGSDWRYPVRHDRAAVNDEMKRRRGTAGMAVCRACRLFMLDRRGANSGGLVGR